MGNSGASRSPLRVAIADDHVLFRQGLTSLLELESDMKLVAEIDRVDDIGPALARTRCDILLLDLQMDRNAINEIEASAQRTRVAVVTASEDPEQALRAFRAGARAVVFKRFAVETLLEAIRAVARGEVWMPRSVQAHVVTGLRTPEQQPLTARERDVIRQVALGLHNAEVARKLAISEQTVKTHLNSIFRKLGVRDRVELALYAAQTGIIGIHERRPG